MGTGRLVALAVGLSLLAWEGGASAFTAPRAGRQGRELASGGAARQHRDIAWRAPASAGRAHAELAAALGASETMWDRDTGVPLRVWGRGVAMSGSVASAEVAARAARAVLERHLAALAPGSRAEDFTLVGNDLSGGIRSVGFAQRHRGRPVIGGQLSVRFKHDRLVAIGSEALPDVRVALTDTPITAAAARTRARAWILADAAGSASADLVEGPFILPIIRSGQRITYREVLRVTVAATQPIGRFAVYLDAASGEPVAREQLLHFATGTLQFHVPQRGPKGAYVDLPAPGLNVFVNGAAATTDTLGALNFVDGGPAAVVAGVAGSLVTVVSEAGPSAVKDLALPPGGVALWADPTSETVDAQLSAYLHANVVKSRIRQVDPGFAFLDKNLLVTTNIADVCNAFSDGDSINFFLSGQGCENTARLSDVVYHEYGHSAHIQGLIEGVGQFDGSLSEGIADYLGATITNDAGLGKGFFTDSPDEALRELDPQGSEWRWPDDLTGEVHDEGRIIGGALWDLRKALVAKLGAQAGVARTDHIWFQSIRRAVDIPTMYPEALLADDDDGDLANGTPNECEINLAFQAHGLLGAGSLSGSVTLAPTTQSGTPVQLQLASGAKACVDLAPTGAELRLRPPNSPIVGIGMNPAPGGFTAVIPPFPDGTLVEYQVVVTFSDNSSASFPANPADQFYQLYHGPVTPLFCTSFDGPPEAEGWQLGPQWQQGAPGGQAGDPDAPFAGIGVVGVNLSGLYTPDTNTALLGPVIATQGFPTVRLQYRRWLAVEDGFFDDATISVNGNIAWQNLDSQAGDLSKTQHRDSEWRFHDLDLTQFVVNDSVQLEFGLRSDAGLEFAGWNIDELCVVGTDGAPVGVCGDGVVGPGEGCDAGPNNSDSQPDACRTSCTPARCGDLVLDSLEQCDDGNQIGGDGCGATCQDEGPAPTTGVPTTSVGDDDDSSITATASESDSESPDSAGIDTDLADRGCACDQGAPDLPALGLGLLALLGLRRRRPR